MGIFTIAVLLVVPLIMGLTGDAAPGAISTYKNAVLWPLFAVHLAPRLRDRVLSRLTFAIVLTAVIEAVLATLQFYSPGTSWINRYAWNTLDTGGVSSFGAIANVRATGTFSYIAGLGSFSIFAFSFLLWRATGTTQEGRERRLGWVGIAAAVACAVLAASRTAIVSEGVLFLGLLFVSRLGKHTWLALSCLALAAGAVTLVVPDAIFGVAQRWEVADDTIYGRITGEGLKGDYWDIIAQYPLGLGMGAVGGYSASVNVFDSGKMTLIEKGFDHGGSKAIIETGILGYCAMLLTWFASASMLWKALISRSESFRISTACLAVVPLYQVCSSIWYDHNATAAYWMLLAFWLSTDPRIRLLWSRQTTAAAKRVVVHTKVRRRLCAGA